MPSQAFSTTLAAGASNNNILVGSMFEFVSNRPRAIQIWAVQDPTANVAFQMRVTHNQTVEIEDGYPLQIASAANIGPLKSDHQVCSFMARPGERIVIALRNVGSASGVSRVLVEHQEF